MKTNTKNEIYSELTIHCLKEHCELLAFHLSELGASGVEERIINNSDYLCLIAYFDQAPSTRVNGQLRLILDTCAGSKLISTEKKENINWFKVRSTFFKPVHVSEQLVIMPEWETEIPHKINIKIRPGMAFGTGNHETTLLALNLIEYYCKEFKRGNFIDVGTGSGILAIAAAKFGLECIAACDVQLESKEEFVYNFQISRIKKIPAFHIGSTESMNDPAELVIANMTAEELTPLLSEFYRITKSEGRIIFSGIYDTKISEFDENMKRFFIPLKKLWHNEWNARICAKK